MFKKENTPENFNEVETIIGESVKVKGNFSGNGNIVVDGSLEGSLKTKGNVFVGEKAKVSGSIEAKEVVVNGEISGNINAKEFLSMGSTAKVMGDVECAQISIERGAILNGKCAMLKNSANISEKESKDDLE